MTNWIETADNKTDATEQNKQSIEESVTKIDNSKATDLSSKDDRDLSSHQEQEQKVEPNKNGETMTNSGVQQHPIDNTLHAEEPIKPSETERGSNTIDNTSNEAQCDEQKEESSYEEIVKKMKEELLKQDSPDDYK